MESYLLYFWIPVLSFGIGLAVDVVITTLSRFHDRSLKFTNWSLPLGITHTLFPAISFAIFSLVGRDSQVILGVSGFILVSLVVYEILCEALGKEPIIPLSDWIGKIFRQNKTFGRKIAIVLSISWDAALCGPALIVESNLGQWSIASILVAFCTFGLIAIVAVTIALILSLKLHRKSFHEAVPLARFTMIGTYLALSIIGGFGVLSLWFAVSGEGNLYLSVILSAYLICMIYITKFNTLWSHSLEEATEAIDA